MKRILTATLVLLAGLAAVPRAAAKAPELLRVQAFAIDMNNGARTASIDIVIERWSTPEELDRLKGVLVETKGGDQLLSALQKVKPRCGYVQTSTSLG